MGILLFLPFIFVFIRQPFVLSLILTLQTLLLAIYYYVLIKNIWLTLILILVVIGGLMITFVYISSLVTSEINTRGYLLLPFTLFYLLFNFKLINYIYSDFLPFNIFNVNNYLRVVMMIILIVVALFVVCSNTLSNKSPLRSFV